MESGTILRVSSAVIFGAALLYGGAVGVMYLAQPKIMYSPWRDITQTPANFGASFTDVWLDTDDGERIHAWWVPAETPLEPDRRFTILFCHGNAGNLSHRASFAAGMARAGINVLMFDYRGFGQSSGRPNEDGTYRDAEAAWRWLTEEENVRPSDIVISGMSLGGAVAAWLASKHTPRALVIESAFTSVPDMVRATYPWLPSGLSRYRYPTVKYVRRVECPVFVMHSPEDEIVPYKFGRRIYEAAPEPRLFYEKRGGHNDAFGLPEREGYAKRRDFMLRFIRDPNRVAAEFDATNHPGD